MAVQKKDAAARERERILRQERARLRTARIARRWHSSILFRFSLVLRETVMMTNLRALSVLLFPFGLISFFRAVILPLLTDDFPLLLPDGIAGAMVLLLSLLFFTYNASLAKVLIEDTFLSRLFFETLGLPHPYLSKRRGLPLWLTLPVGLALGALALVLSPLLVVAVTAAACIFVLTLVSPEFGLLLLAILFPLSALLPEPILPLVAVLTLALLSYLLKLLRGKRRFSFTLTDLAVLTLALFLLLSCVFAHGGSRGHVMDGVKAAVLLTGGYLLTANLLETRRTLLQFTKGLLLGGAILGLAGILCGAVRLASPEELSPSLLALLDIAETVMGDSVGASAILLLLFPLLPVALGESRIPRLQTIPAALLITGALALTLSPLVYLALLLSILLFLMITRRRSPLPLVLLFGILPNFLIALPEGWREALSSFSFLGLGDLLADSFAAQADALALISRYPFGIGLGGADAGNIHLQMISAAGIPSLLLFLLLLLSIADCTTRAEACLREPHLRRLTAGVQSGTLALLVLGLFLSPLDDLRVLLVFAMILGLLVAVRRAIHESRDGPHPTTHKEQTTAAVEVRLSRRRGRS